VEALVSGKRAAATASRYLAGEELRQGLDEIRTQAPELPDVRREAQALDRLTPIPRVERSEVAPTLRAAAFTDTVLPLSGWSARDEAERCLTCGSRSTIAYLDDCQTCRLCQLFCPTKAIAVSEGVLQGQLNGWGVVSLQGAVAPGSPTDEGGSG
jgi:NAD-dependent dihydropyrimidine dehydrogenase PreA subunit